jgi:hypothetical protein
MDGAAGEDEKKPFDAEQGADDDIIPDPQEVLFFDHRAPSTKCWMIKVRAAVQALGLQTSTSTDAQTSHGALVGCRHAGSAAREHPRLRKREQGHCDRGAATWRARRRARALRVPHTRSSCA